MISHKQMDIAKGVGIGMAVGGALGLGAAALRQPHYQRSAKKGFHKALKTFNSVISAIS